MLISTQKAIATMRHNSRLIRQQEGDDWFNSLWP